MATSVKNLVRAADALRRAALDYPDAIEDHPWGECAVKVNKKVFLFMCQPNAKQLSLSCKLPKTGKKMLKAHDFASPTGYGLGKSGWVSAKFEPGDTVPLELLTDWIDESFRAVAPRKVVAYLDDPDAEEKPVIARKVAKKRSKR